MDQGMHRANRFGAVYIPEIESDDPLEGSDPNHYWDNRHRATQIGIRLEAFFREEMAARIVEEGRWAQMVQDDVRVLSGFWRPGPHEAFACTFFIGEVLFFAEERGHHDFVACLQALEDEANEVFDLLAA